MKSRDIKDMLRSKKKAKVVAIGTAVAGVVAIAVVVGMVTTKKDIVKTKSYETVATEQVVEKKLAENNIVEGKNHTYKAEKNAVSPADVRKMLNGTYDGALKDEKVVFLTFDDGPSSKTEKVLNILKDKGVNGTFFILGENIKKVTSNNEIIKRIVNDGNSIGNHSYTHDFKKLYPGGKVNTDSFMDEYKKTENELKEILGENFKINLVRLPGGENTREYYKDGNLPSFLDTLNKEGISSIDWNALNGDAEGKSYSTEEMMNYVKKTSTDKDKIVLLMHDSEPKDKTVQILPEVIDYYKSQGYTFKIMG